MLIECLDRMEQFESVRADWERVYAEDTEADYFRSWGWLRAWLDDTKRRWFVLAARPEEAFPYVGFLALAEERKNGRALTASKELHIAGNRVSDYTGFVAVPGSSDETVRAMAAHLRDGADWDRFHLMDTLDRRMGIFLEEFSGRGFHVEEVEELPCAYVDLPGSWESFLSDTLAKKPRQNLRRAMRRIEDLDGFRSTQADKGTLGDSIGIVLDLWQARWGEQTEGALRTFRSLFEASYSNGNLYLQVLWQGETPIGGRLGFVDREKGTFLGYMNCFNEEFGNLSPGTALVGYSVRYAIENRLRRYDFLRGGEEYKSSFGASERFNRSYLITRQGLGPSIRKLAGRLAAIRSAGASSEPAGGGNKGMEPEP